MEKKETSIGAVVINSQNKFLLLFQRKASYWEFPKGHMEGVEDELVTMKREVIEETGIKNYEVIDGFRHETMYSFERDDVHRQKKVIFYLVRTEDPVEISLEHKEYTWVDYEQAQEMVAFVEEKETLERVKNFLENYAK
ncbi:NUDIX domain-containing protein [Candidatus Woesearchaeota archaeon]|nr:NUDIX domain-containing protein [Candidatus Woesearchaeota archaeon]